MDELLMIEYLKRKGLYNIKDDELDSKVKQLIHDKYIKEDTIETKAHNEIQEELYSPVVEEISLDSSMHHFNESYARYVVSTMYHYSGGRKYVGEKFDMIKAKEIRERYKGILPKAVTYSDVYVAINEHYHNYCNLFKMWFSEGMEQKIIESAIVEWFQDEDYKGDCKLADFFVKH